MKPLIIRDYEWVKNRLGRTILRVYARCLCGWEKDESETPHLEIAMERHRARHRFDYLRVRP